MGETMDDRIDMAVELSEEEILRTVAMFRYISPNSNIRIAAGRKLISENVIVKCSHPLVEK